MNTPQFFGTDSETYYQDTQGRVWLVQSPDMDAMVKGTLAAPTEMLPGAVSISFQVIDPDMIRLSDMLDACETHGLVSTDDLTKYIVAEVGGQ